MAETCPMKAAAGNQLPKVTIGLPVYNMEKLLAQSLDCLLAQTCGDFVLVLSDNASTDGTGEVCRQYAARDDRIRYIRQPANLGAAGNFSFVLSQARTPYFMWASGDDLWDPDCVRQFAAVLDDNPDVGGVFCNFFIYNRVTHERTKRLVTPSVSPHARGRLLTRFMDCAPDIVFSLFRTELIRQVGFPNFDFADVYVGQYVSVQSKIFIVSDFLFSHCINEAYRKPYSITGKRVTYWDYFKNTYALITQSFGTGAKLFLLPVLFRSVFEWYRRYRIKGY